MLLSPGHSPRHISPAPSSASEKTLALDSPSTTTSNPRKRGPVVLDEDSYVAAIEKIIERDFFPDLPKLRDRLDWLAAVRTQDPIQIRDAQLKILERRQAAAAAAKTPSATPATAANRTRTHTPFGFSATPFGTDQTPVAPPPSASTDADPNSEPSPDSSLSLDEFFRRYTSEDNESFSKIMEKVNRKQKERYAHLLEGETPRAAIEDVKRDRITDGYGTSGQTVSTLDGWKYTAKNLLMYNPSDGGEAKLTEEERAERIKGLTKEISRNNTRLHGKSVAEARPTKEEAAVAILYTPVAGTTPAGAAWPFPDREAERLKKYDLEDLRKTPNPFFAESGKKSEDGYSFLKTPSPAPGVDESPFMTWGDIEGTPLRLDLEETPGGSSEGSHFRIPLPPSRDVKAHSMSREAARKLRERSKMFQKPPLPSPARGGSASPSVRTLSPAAQKFVRNAIAKSSRTVDETLRASYRGATPSTSTPKGRTGLTRFSRDGSLGSRSPSTRKGSTPPW